LLWCSLSRPPARRSLSFVADAPAPFPFLSPPKPNQNKTSKNYHSIDFKIKKVMIDGKSAKLQIWDTAGQERFRTITSGESLGGRRRSRRRRKETRGKNARSLARSLAHAQTSKQSPKKPKPNPTQTAYYRGAMGILLVYDVTDESSFNNVRNWMRNIDAHASEGVDKLLVGNKADCTDSGGAGGVGKRAVPFSRGQALADEFGIPFVETSAKDGSHVPDAFLTIARDVMARLAREAAGEGGGGGGSQGGGGIKLGEAAPARGGRAGARGACCSGA
jgi:Ras-related protein Rab-8A